MCQDYDNWRNRVKDIVEEDFLNNTHERSADIDRIFAKLGHIRVMKGDHGESFLHVLFRELFVDHEIKQYVQENLFEFFHVISEIHSRLFMMEYDIGCSSSTEDICMFYLKFLLSEEFNSSDDSMEEDTSTFLVFLNHPEFVENVFNNDISSIMNILVKALESSNSKTLCNDIVSFLNDWMIGLNSGHFGIKQVDVLVIFRYYLPKVLDIIANKECLRLYTSLHRTICSLSCRNLYSDEDDDNCICCCFDILQFLNSSDEEQHLSFLSIINFDIDNRLSSDESLISFVENILKHLSCCRYFDEDTYSGVCNEMFIWVCDTLERVLLYVFKGEGDTTLECFIHESPSSWMNGKEKRNCLSFFKDKQHLDIIKTNLIGLLDILCSDEYSWSFSQVSSLLFKKRCQFPKVYRLWMLRNRNDIEMSETDTNQQENGIPSSKRMRRV